MRLFALAVAVATLSTPSAFAASADSAATATATDAPSEAQAKPAKQKKICRLAGNVTGSRLAGRRVCKTSDEWAAYDEKDTEIGRIPGARPVPPPPSAGPGR